MLSTIRFKLLIFKLKMLRKRQFVACRRILRSKTFFLIVTSLLALTAIAIFFFYTDIDLGYWSQRQQASIYRISWLYQKTQIKLLDFDKGLSNQYLHSLRKKETRLLKLQMTKHKKYVFNYTRCLSKEFTNFEKILGKVNRRYPLYFGEMMKKLHERCSVEIFGSQGNKCQFNGNIPAAALSVHRKPKNMSELKRELTHVRLGGIWSPIDCVPKAKLAVIIPFRDRSDHLITLLRQLHPILKRQNLLYRIFVIEQADEYPFNRGKLLNVGYREALKMFDFDCFVFHDVDLIPENDENDYGCPASPRHMSIAVDKFSYTLPYKGLFGGVEMFTKAHFNKVNGFSNSYWGWGAEDDDMYKRIVKHGLKLTRPSLKIGRYSMIKHESSERPPDRIDKLQVAENSFNSNGLVALLYTVIKKQEHLLYTLVRVDLRMEEDMLY